MDINRISGYLPGKIVFFLMQARVLHQPRHHPLSVAMRPTCTECATRGSRGADAHLLLASFVCAFTGQIRVDQSG